MIGVFKGVILRRGLLMKSKFLYMLLVGFVISYILYVLYEYVIIDPSATSFLSHKTQIIHTIKLHIWLTSLYIHILFAIIAMLSGAINFSTTPFNRHQRFHHINGYIYIISILMVNLTSGYMAPSSTGGRITSIGFNTINVIWPCLTIIAIISIKKRKVLKHRNWMIRSYAFCFTNFFIHFLTYFFYKQVHFTYDTSYTIGVYGSIVINLAAAEWVIRKIIK